MKDIIIVKLGDTSSATQTASGDFEHWIMREMKAAAKVVDPRAGDTLPNPQEVIGAVVTGSHAMVTQKQDWSEQTARWLVKAVKKEVPVLGICYGHQLLAHAHGGLVDYHPQGMEIGTVPMQLTQAATEDPLLRGLPPSFPAQTVHAQSVLRLPHGAVLLARNDFEPHHAFRLGPCAWGVQFHPEFDEMAIREYLRRQSPLLKEQQRDPEQLEANVTATPDASSILARFAALAQSGNIGR